MVVQFIDAVARRTGLSRPATTVVTNAVLRSLGERLTRAQAEQLAAALAPELAAVLIGTRHGEPFDLEELVLRVRYRTATYERALEYIAVVGMTIGETVGNDVLAPVRASLPPAIGFLLRAPSERRAVEPVMPAG